MEQLALRLMGRIDGPSAAPTALVIQAKTYREAVRLSWGHRRVHYATQSQLAGEAGLYAPHVSDYLNKDDKPSRRSLPAEHIGSFEAFTGNTIVSQWLAAQAKLTVLEEMQATRAAA